MADDYSQANDLATTMPDKLRNMQELFLVEAAKYQVFPLDNDFFKRVLAPKPSYTAGRNEFTYAGKLTGTPNGDAPNILAKSYTITADVEVPSGGGDGMIVTDGGRIGGFIIACKHVIGKSYKTSSKQVGQIRACLEISSDMKFGIWQHALEPLARYK